MFLAWHSFSWSTWFSVPEMAHSYEKGKPLLLLNMSVGDRRLLHLLSLVPPVLVIGGNGLASPASARPHPPSPASGTDINPDEDGLNLTDRCLITQNGLNFLPIPAALSRSSQG